QPLPRGARPAKRPADSERLGDRRPTAGDQLAAIDRQRINGAVRQTAAKGVPGSAIPADDAAHDAIAGDAECAAKNKPGLRWAVAVRIPMGHRVHIAVQAGYRAGRTPVINALCGDGRGSEEYEQK